VPRRKASRVLLFGPDRRLFLIRSGDPANPNGGLWWEIPGGGMELGESSAHCAERELWEEGGFEEVQVGPVIATQQVQFTFAGLYFDQDEFIHVATTEQRDIRPPQGLEFFEAMAFQGAAWWTVDEVLASSERFLPTRLQELVAFLSENGVPEEPLDITPV
jgi:8-oxo-dGTP pyrophosphatase MutT (NUDIX family)